MRTIVVGTRKSKLAMTQTNWVMDRLKEMEPNLTVELETIVTKGDKILDVTLSKVGGKGLFVKEIESALLSGEIDLAVHSMKDLPAEMPKGLLIGAIPIREDVRDCFLSRDGSTLEELPSGAVVGTSSLRRQAQILAIRPDLRVEPIRGNIDTRVQKMNDGQFDAIILATAGLNRISWQEDIAELISVKTMLPAVGQGALAIQCREDDREIRALLAKINHEETARAVRAERAFLQAFHGGCHLPIAAYAQICEDQIHLKGLVGDPSGKQMIADTIIGKNEIKMGQELANRLIELGADELLASVSV
ncbi:hydroxymethylbilane synthase [Thermoactinomyces sp. DSM 45891]|uniref:hydroxymethylbilane synthase n=1 Tax=Thermoactinomyces sp. DSM 45891 TaxID=1761907 RepID=UPI0009242564|nr:hydroxymethylbilane synthase [Thermoactinomyces sp. DSM 45891]SFX11313.1 hydroxymethylbilane synthase [Thermoactinomyces sp. DSM 45891]